MRRAGRVAWAVGTALGTTVLAAPAATAAPLERIVNTIDEVSCVFETEEGPLVFFYATSSDFGSGSGMFVESQDGDLLLLGDEGTATFSPDLTAEVPLTAFPTGAPAGTASVSVPLQPTGEPVVEVIRERSGNSWTTGTTTTVDYLPGDAVVELPGLTVLSQADDCSGSRIAFDVRTTNPAGRVYRSSDFGSDICPLGGLPGGAVLLGGNDLRSQSFQIVVETGDDVQEADGDLDVRARRGTATTDLVSSVTGEVVAELTIDVSLERSGRRGHETVRDGRISERVSWVPYTVDVVVRLSDGRTGRARCEAELVTSQIIVRPGAD